WGYYTTKMFGISAWVVLNPCLIDADSFLTKGIKLPKKLDFRSYVMILSFILSLQILFHDFRFYFAIKLVFSKP
ncbi:hypothetical protein RGC35_08180, partial [Helicobacter pylori]|uniref:hypothetical protein n=1 Tax=Helicobacter pylori TaxID=210 RepID=UPI002927AC62